MHAPAAYGDKGWQQSSSRERLHPIQQATPWLSGFDGVVLAKVLRVEIARVATAPTKKRPRRDVAKPSGAENVSYTPPLTHPMAFGAAGVGCKIGPTVRERLVGFCQKLVRPCQPGLK